MKVQSLLDESHKLDPWPFDEGPKPDEVRSHFPFENGRAVGSI